MEMDHTAPVRCVVSTNVQAVAVAGRNYQSRGPYEKVASGLTGKSFVDRDVSGGRTYYYAVTAVTPEGSESPFSIEISVMIP
jgi:hypothetical protein